QRRQQMYRALYSLSESKNSIYSFFFSSRRRHTRWPRDWNSDVCSSDLHHLGWLKYFRKHICIPSSAYGGIHFPRIATNAGGFNFPFLFFRTLFEKRLFHLMESVLEHELLIETGRHTVTSS